LIVAIDVLLLVHVPPDVALLSVPDTPVQPEAPPVIEAGETLTVTTAVVVLPSLV
jgi:hypothetical protein